MARSTDLPEDLDEMWTAYAFTLAEIRTEVETAISVGIPAAPSDLWLRPADGGSPVGVPTRWTQAYRGRRDLGVRGQKIEGERRKVAQRGGDPAPIPVRIKQEYADELNALAALVDEGLVQMRHVGDGTCGCRGTSSITAACARLTMGDAREAKRETVRTRQRAANVEFQREHIKRRAVGLERRHATKLSRSAPQEG
jgi:hypothetical protein